MTSSNGKLPFFSPKSQVLLGCTFLFLLMSTFSYSQKNQANHWYFGDHYGLHFSNGIPQTDYTSSIYTYEACATISDKDGNLLFYTNGGGRANQAVCGHIWNKNHEVMAGGNLGFDLGGGHSSAQGVVAFEKPGTENVYCLITVDEFESINTSGLPFGKGCKYFEIDMNANGGLGEVIVVNQKLMEPSFEYLGATIHSNCEDYWVIAPTGHYAFADDPNVADSFYVFLVTENGPLTPQVTPMPEGRPNIPDEYGLIKITPDGKYFTCGSHLYGFDTSTGAIDYSMNLIDTMGLGELDPRGFSSDSRFFYQFKTTPQDSLTKLIISQYDLEETSFLESKQIVGQVILSEFAVVSSPQLAPDGKLYFLIQEGYFTSPTTLAALESPNAAGAGVNPNYNILTISNVPDNRFLSFGNYTDNIFKYDPVIPHDLGSDISIPCEDLDSVNLYGPENMEIYLWSTGAIEQDITALEPGVYWVEFWEGCEMGVDTLEIEVFNDLFKIDLGSDTTICGQSILLLEPELVPDATYLWHDSSTTFDYEITKQGMYWLEVQMAHCKDRDSIIIFKVNIPMLELGPDLVICEGEEIRIDPIVSSAINYEWQDGSDKPFLIAVDNGAYQLTVSNECGSASDELQLNVFQCETCDVYTPNVFSPNNDGYNDEFQLFSTCQLTHFDIKIFDRWGNQVYGSQQADGTWNGNLKGRICPTAVYAFIMELEWLNENGKPIREVRTGDILLMR